MFRFVLRVVPLLSLVMVMTASAAAQDHPAVTVALPGYWETLLSDAVFDEFEVQTGVRVVPIFSNMPSLSAYDADGVEDFLDDTAAYVSSADVVYVESNNLMPEATRAGYYLDLAPLANADPALNRDDIYDAVWNAFRWDNGQWALPVSATPLLTRYNREAFDQAGVPYPTGGWTMQDIAQAARALAERDASGTVTLPGVSVSPDVLPYLLTSLTGENYYDETIVPVLPDFAEDALSEPLLLWRELLMEGVLTTDPGERFAEIPLQLGESVAVFSFSFGSAENSGSTTGSGTPQMIREYLPGGLGGLAVRGFSISSGTIQPQIAYQLARFLSQRPEVVAAATGEAARRSLIDVESDGSSIQIIDPERDNRSPEEQALIEDVLQNGLPPSELIFAGYLSPAIAAIESGVDPITALRDAEQAAIALVQNASLRAGTPVSVTVPAEELQLSEGEIVLRFGYTSFANPLPNQAEWDRIIADFVSQDPQIGAVELVTTPASFQDRLSTTDCFYSPRNLATVLDPAQIYPVGPLLAADPILANDTFVVGALEQVERDGQVLGIPLTIQPQALRYQPDLFAAAGLSEPYDGWTMSEFADALVNLQSVVDNDVYPFTPGFGNTYLLLLIAAHGGLPLDFSVDPVRVDFTSPETVEAIRNVLDLAKSGLIDYQPLSEGNGFMVFDGATDVPLMADTLFASGLAAGDDTSRLVSYPVGNRYAPVAYEIGTGYISASTAYPEACYRWLSYLAQNAYVFPAMPALNSTLNSPNLVNARGQNVVDAYREIVQTLGRPDAVRIPVNTRAISTWLNRAFDAYVFDGADLVTVLSDAQTRTDAYITCTAQIDPALTGDALQQETERCRVLADG